MLAYDRWSYCTRVVEGSKVAVVDNTGEERDFLRVDLKAGLLWYYDKMCREIRERGEFSVVIANRFKQLYSGS